MEIHDLIRAGKYREALAWANAQLAHKPKDWQLGYLKGSVLYKMQRYADARTVFATLYRANPKSGKLLYSMALVCLAQGQEPEGALLLEHAYHNGNDAAIYKILELLFVREGSCEYESCTDICCKNVVLKDTDGLVVKDDQGLERLLLDPQQNRAWQHKRTAPNGHWVFDCSQLGERNACRIHQERPQVCRDFPANILALKPACSYRFRLNEPSLRIRSRKCLAVVLDILEAYGYQHEKELLAEGGA